MKKGFTLIEVVVAVGLLAMVIGFSSVIFKVSIETRRTAGANAEIMQKLRAITNQLNRDFAGLRPDAPLMIWFEQDTNSTDPNRYDQIMFFADGDFQSTQLYNSTPVIGNVARIYYGQASVWRTLAGYLVFGNARTLARRTHILTADTGLPAFPDGNDFVGSFIPSDNNNLEYDSISLSQWKVITNDPLKNDVVIATCFNNDGRPQIDFVSQPPVGLHMLMTEGVGSFAVQWGYLYIWPSGEKEYRWWPADNPDGDAATDDSDFGSVVGVGRDRFGIYYNMPGGVGVADWSGPEEARTENLDTNDLPSLKSYPPALKFTFRIYDSKGIIKGGRTFTHIVYLGN